MSWDDDVTLSAPPVASAKTGGDPFERALKAEKVSGTLEDVARSIYQQESSRGKKTQTSNAGAVGPLQLRPETFRRFAEKGWNISDPEQNIRAGIRYLKKLGRDTGNDPKLMAVGYYGGEGAIPKALKGQAVRDPRNPNAPDTLQYGDQVSRRAKNDSDAWYSTLTLGEKPGEKPTQPAVPAPAPEEPTRGLGAEAARQLGLTARAAGPYAAGAALGAAAGAPFAGVGAIPGAAAGVGAVSLLDLAGGAYNPIASRFGLPQLPTPTVAMNKLADVLGLPQPGNGLERVVQAGASGMAGAGAGAAAARAGSALAGSAPMRNALSTLAENPVSQIAAGAGGSAGSQAAAELGGGPLAQLVAGVAGGGVPLTLANLARSSDQASRNASRLLRKALADNSPEEWNKARQLLTDSQKNGVPLMGPELFPQGSRLGDLAQEVAANSPEARNRLLDFLKPRGQQIEDAARRQVGQLGENVGTQAAANQAQEAADTAIRKAQEYRTEASSPYYQAQKGSDREAINLSDQMRDLPGQIAELAASRGSAVQVAGKLHAFVNDQINRMNQSIMKGWFNDNGKLGVTDIRRRQAERFQTRAEEAKSGTYAALNRAGELRAQLEASQRQLEATADQLAQKNLPGIRSQVDRFLSGLDQQIRLAGNTREGQILKDYRNQLAPNGEPLVLPSQLESVYKDIRNKTQLGLNPSPEERTTAGVLGGHVKDLDKLITEVSPTIKAGREVYKQLSDEVVNPLVKGPVGKLAGRGAENTKEAVRSRTLSELNSKDATPERIATIADVLGQVDKKAFPNLVRAHIEDVLDKSLKTQRGGGLPASGVRFRDALEGTPQQRTNLRTMVQKVAETQGLDPTKTYEGFGRFLDVLDATGRLASVPAGKRAADTAEVAAQHAATAVLDLKAPGARTVINMVRDFARRNTYKKLADVMTSPETLRDMADLANYKGGDPKLVQGVAAILRAAGRPASASQGQE